MYKHTTRTQKSNGRKIWCSQSVFLLFKKMFIVLYFQVNQSNKVEVDIRDGSVVFVVNQRTEIIHIDGR